MRLLVCAPWFAPARAFGGSVAAAIATVEGVLEAGHEVTVATTDVLDPRRRLPADAPEEPAGARVLRFRNVSQRLAGANVPLPRGLRRWLGDHVREFDVVLLQDLYSFVNLLGARAARGAAVPYVLQTHGTLPATRQRGRSISKRLVLALWGKRTVREAAACLYVSEAELAEFLRLGVNPTRLHHIPPPLDLPSAEGVPRAAAPTILYLGQLHPMKRVDLLINPFAHVHSALPEARLEVAGPPSRHGEKLRSRAARLRLGEAVRFPGTLTGPAKVEALASAHVFALLSAAEGVPLAVLEALACGTPVVLSPGAGLHEVEGVAGIVCDGTAKGAAEALVALLEDPARAHALGEAGRSLAAPYRREVVEHRTVELLERVATEWSKAA
jgi:glycosyltransferase involved in cell wall biosynthesis